MQYMDRIGGAMQTKRIILTTVLALSLIMAGCSGADENTNDQAQTAPTNEVVDSGASESEEGQEEAVETENQNTENENQN